MKKYNILNNEKNILTIEFLEEPFKETIVEINNLEMKDESNELIVDFKASNEDMEKNIEENKEQFEKLFGETINEVITSSLEIYQKNIKDNDKNA